MAKCCPRACGRLTTAAIFIAIGIVQLIAGIILLKSDFAYMLSGPNVWTAFSNISVGILLGIASTVWKSINKNSNRHANRRKFLASLVSSIFILNAVTAAMLIISEGNNLLAIDLEKGSAKEILAYAYATSVCSPIVCVVVSIAFLTGICFRQKPKAIKTLDFNNILNTDDAQLYNWVYTSNLPKPDPKILKNPVSSESESSSTSESDSDSSSDLPVPLHIRSRSSLNDIKNSQHVSLENRSLPFSIERNRISDHSVSSDFGKIRSLPRLKSSSLIRSPMPYCKSINTCRSVGSGRRIAPGVVAYARDSKLGTPMRMGMSENSILEKSARSPTFQYSSVLCTSPKSKQMFSTINQDTPYRQDMIKTAKCLAMDASISHQSSMADSTACEDLCHEVSDLSFKSINYSPNPHLNICRTSTGNQTEVQQELENLDNSAIHFETGETAYKEIYLDESMPEFKCNGKLSLSNPSADSTINVSLRSGGDLSMLVRNSNFRKKLSSRLVPATGPVVSDNQGFYKTSNRKSARSTRLKPYCKSKDGYDKYLQTGFSSFRGQVDEIDAMTYPKKHNSSVNKSPMTSISEKAPEEELDTYLPSTSTHTSGYMSASYEESEDETDSKPNSGTSILSARHQPSPSQKLMADEIREVHRKRTERVLNNGSLQDDSQHKNQLILESQTAISTS